MDCDRRLCKRPLVLPDAAREHPSLVSHVIEYNDSTDTREEHDRELCLSRFVVSRTDEAVDRALDVVGCLLVTKRQHHQCAHDFALRFWNLKLRQPVEEITLTSGQWKFEASDMRELRPDGRQRILHAHPFHRCCKPKVLGEEGADIVLNCRDKCLLLERVLLECNTNTEIGYDICRRSCPTDGRGAVDLGGVRHLVYGLESNALIANK